MSFFLDHCSKCSDGYSFQRSQVIASSFPFSCDWKWWCLSGWVVCFIISQSFSTSLTHSGGIASMRCRHYYTDSVISQSKWYGYLFCTSFCLYAIGCDLNLLWYTDQQMFVYNYHTVLSCCIYHAEYNSSEMILVSEVSGLVHSEGNRSSQHMRVRAGQPIWNEALEGRSNSGHHNSAVVKYFLPSETFWREVLSTSTR